VQFCAADQPANFPTGTGPKEAQRMIFGYTARQDYRDAKGRRWRPATEFVIRSGAEKDSVAEAWWTAPATNAIAGTADPELYRYGVHGREFWVNATVGPGRYAARLKFAAARGPETRTNHFSILINGRRVVENLDVAATAGGINRAVDLVFDDLSPSHGIIEIRFQGAGGRGQAFVQALEITPGRGGKGAKPVSAAR
jgi:hypothetical protein